MSSSGTVKFFNEMKGFGFIEGPNGDVFVHVKECNGAQPVEGDQVTYDEEFDEMKQKTRAVNVQGCTGVNNGPGKGGMGFGGGKGGFGKGGGFGGKGGFGGGYDQGFGGFSGKGGFGGGYDGGYQQGGYW